MPRLPTKFRGQAQGALLVAGMGLLGILVAGCFSVTWGAGGYGADAVPATSPIQHVVILMQENRTFDNLFHGFPGADSAETGMSNGTPVPLTEVPLAENVDLPHHHVAWWRAWDRGKMDGFARTGAVDPAYPYSYVRQSDIAAYWTLAKRYTLSDRMFQSNTGPSFPAHQYMIAGQSANAAESPTALPWGCDAPAGTTVPLLGPNGTVLPGPFPCFDYRTVGDVLDQAGISWRYYSPSAAGERSSFTGFEAIRHIFYGQDWESKVISPQTTVLTDITAGHLAHVTWVVPDMRHSDHPGNNSSEGPQWVASVVNAIGASKFWSSTAIFITWDDWGGWYDHVAPNQVDKMGPGFRVPLIVVSPYAKHGYVSHQNVETASLLTYIEKNFRLPSLNARDATAGDLSDCFDYRQEVRPFTTIPTRLTVQRLLLERPTGMPDDD